MPFYLLLKTLKISFIVILVYKKMLTSLICDPVNHSVLSGSYPLDGIWKHLFIDVLSVALCFASY